MTATQTVVREFDSDLVVSDVDHVATDVVSITLVDPLGRALPPWTPGAHIDLVLDDGFTRQYSLCGSAADPGRWQVAVLKAPQSRGGSVAVHALKVGSSVRVRGPRNHFPVIPAPRYVFVAGGIGITPILAMIRELAAAGAEWELHYGGRSRDSMAFTRELAAHADRVHLVPEDEQGRLDLEAILAAARPGALIYACGPEPLLAALQERCSDWPAGVLHLERFAARAVEIPEQENDFELVLQGSGRTLQVPADRSVFDVVREAGVSVLGSCLEGICGTCETGVIEGDVDHRDSVLEADERAGNEVMMICVSRCRSARLVLDL